MMHFKRQCNFYHNVWTVSTISKQILKRLSSVSEWDPSKKNNVTWIGENIHLRQKKWE